MNVVWTDQTDQIRTHGWSVLPRCVRNYCSVVQPGQVTFGALRVFPQIYWLPFKARFLHMIKTILLGLRLFPKRRLSARNGVNFTGDEPPGWEAIPNERETAFVRQSISRYRPDVLLFSYCWMVHSIKDWDAASSIPTLVLTHDVRHRQTHLTAEGVECRLGTDFNKGDEIEMLRLCDLVLAIQEKEAELFRTMLPGKDVLVIPKAAEIRPNRSYSESNRVLFVGSGAGPNVKGLTWFLDRVWPEIRQAIPNAEFHVCGKVGDAFREKQYDGVRFLGLVTNLEDEYEQAQLVVVPLFQGSGVKIKLIEALAYGKACVATSLCLEGLHEKIAEALVSADSVEDFQSACIHLLRGTEQRRVFEHRALSAASSLLSPEKCYGPLLDWVVTACHGPSTPSPLVHVPQ